MKTVLLVEDSYAIRETIKESLESAGLNVVDAPNGSLAINMLADKKPEIDAAILDIMMPGHGGTVRDYLLKMPQYKDIIIIYHTSLDPEQIDKRILEGALYITKDENSIEKITGILQRRLSR